MSGNATPPGAITSAETVPISSRFARLNAHLLTCDAANFHAAQFERDKLACPPSVARSVHKRQAEFYFGRMAARSALAEHGVHGVEVAIGAAREPVWPVGFIGSITHCLHFAAAAVAPCGELHGIGIDAEWAASPSEVRALKQEVLDAGERALLERLPSNLPIGVLTALVFSAKESVFKATYASLGRYVDFSAARLVHLCERSGRLTLELNQDFHPQLPRGHACEVEFRLLRPEVIFTSFVW